LFLAFIRILIYLYCAKKRIFFLGDTLDQLCSFPLKARSDAGSELRRVQMGLDPMDWKPMKTIGAGGEPPEIDLMENR
jgi:phage-related protein